MEKFTADEKVAIVMEFRNKFMEEKERREKEIEKQEK